LRVKRELGEALRLECESLLGTAEAVAEELGINLRDALLLLILRELVILNAQARELKELRERQNQHPA